MKAVIDTDPGTDDAIALMMALNCRDLDIQGLTTVGGNVPLARTTRNTLRLLDYLGRSEVPVARGSARPLRGHFEYAYYFHGASGLTARLPEHRSQPRPLGATDYIISLAYSFPGELTLIALGPLTNVAKAIAKEPRAREWIREIIVMGGAVEVAGNVTPHAEFNVYSDPIAAGRVLSSGIPITLVGLDVCNGVVVERDELPWPLGRSSSATLAEKILAGWFASHPGHGSYNLCDPTAIVAAIRPDLFDFKRATVSVETADPERMGSTTAIYGDGNVKVACDVDAVRAKKVIESLVVGA